MNILTHKSLFMPISYPMVSSQKWNYEVKE